MNEPDLSNFSMLDLFRIEVEAQTTTLNNSLLALEQNLNSTETLKTLMRAAHSIKGAARIVDLDAVVQLAHELEECFVSAQAGSLVFSSDQIDFFLQAVDLLFQLAKIPELETDRWLTEHQPIFHELTQTLRTRVREAGAPIVPSTPAADPSPPVDPQSLPSPDRPETPPLAPPIADALSAPTAPQSEFAPPPTSIVDAPPIVPPSDPGNPIGTSSTWVEPAPPIGTASSIQTTPQTLSPTSDRSIRVSANNLNRLMGLAGESLVEANWLQPFADSLFQLRNQQAELAGLLEQFQTAAAHQSLSQRSEDSLNAVKQQVQLCQQTLADRLNELELFIRRSTNLSDRLYREVIATHMRPFADGVQAFPRLVRDLAKQLGKQVKFEILGSATKVDRDILEKLEVPLTHLLSNAIDHGLETPSERVAAGKSPEGSLRLEAVHRAGMLSITVTDDGRGIDLEQLRQTILNRQLTTPDLAAQLTEAELLEFLFLPGFSTGDQVTQISGRGVGLDIVQSMVQQVGGTVRPISRRGKGMSFHLQLPLTLSVVRTLLVQIAGEPYAFPLTRIDQIARLDRTTIQLSENYPYVSLNGHNIGLIAAHQVLELASSHFTQTHLATVILSNRGSRYGVIVDQFLGEQDLVIRPLDPRLGKVKNLSAAALLADGSPVLVIDVEDFVRSIEHLLAAGNLTQIRQAEQPSLAKTQKRILVVDDSITVREMERKLLQNQGYAVEVAVNGIDGWNAIRTGQFDLIITDIDMPRMNGIELVTQLRQNPSFKALPVIVVSYKDREEDRLRGLEAGANYYLTKSSFQDDTFLHAVLDLIGGSEHEFAQ